MKIMKIFMLLAGLLALALGGIINKLKFDQASEQGFGRTIEAAADADCCGNLHGDRQQKSDMFPTQQENGDTSAELENPYMPKKAIAARSLELTITFSKTDDKPGDNQEVADTSPTTEEDTVKPTKSYVIEAETTSTEDPGTEVRRIPASNMADDSQIEVIPAPTVPLNTSPAGQPEKHKWENTQMIE